MNSYEAYDRLRTHSKETAYLASTISVLAWDQRTQIPSKGHPHRVAQLSFLEKILHQRLTDPSIGEWLTAVETTNLVEDPLSVEAVNIRDWRRSYDRATKIPEDLAVELARATAEAQAVWETARPANDWNGFKPHLEHIVALKREEAQALGYEREPYDALLDDYERGETATDLEPVFDRLTRSLVHLLNRLRGSPSGSESLVGGRSYPAADQEGFGKFVAQSLGYEMDAGRLDVSAHPFTTGIGPGDSRITTRYSEDDFGEGFFAIVHEAGHAMYHQGLPLEHWGEPFCRPISLGINESQSRMWENMVARSEAFWRHFFPRAQDLFPSLAAVRMNDFLGAINRVTPDLIRVEADEVTYNLHILMRFELERAIMIGDLSVDDLPSAWNEKTGHYLGLTPPDHATGVMQDVHWSAGAIGYFPTYTLGNLYAAQFFAKANEELGDLESLFARGEFAPLLEWLRQNIHSQGTRYLPRDLVRTVTGEDLNPQYLIDYLDRKYGRLCDV